MKKVKCTLFPEQSSGRSLRLLHFNTPSRLRFSGNREGVFFVLRGNPPYMTGGQFTGSLDMFIVEGIRLKKSGI